MATAFPWHTLTVNVLGCFIMGLLVELMALKLNVGNEMRAFLTTGILGGFTTFSAFSLDFALLVERKAYAAGRGLCRRPRCCSRLPLSSPGFIWYVLSHNDRSEAPCRHRPRRPGCALTAGSRSISRR